MWNKSPAVFVILYGIRTQERFDKRSPITYDRECICRGVAQSGSAQRLGRWGRGFESLRPDHPLMSFPDLMVQYLLV